MPGQPWGSVRKARILPHGFSYGVSMFYPLLLTLLVFLPQAQQKKEKCAWVCAGSSDELRSQRQIEKAKKEGRCVRICDTADAQERK